MIKKENKPRYKLTKFGWIPEDWEVYQIQEVAEIDKRSLNGDTDPDYEFDYVSLSDVDSEILKIETNREKFATSPSRARRIVQQGDILLATVRPNLQGFSIIKDDVSDLIASTGFAVISAKTCNNEYLYHHLFGPFILKQFYRLLVGSNYPAVNSSDVKKLKIPFPKRAEQQAIATCLTTWDETIQTLIQLIKQKERRKKGLMQSLLTGKKRLKGFSGKWKEIHIKEVTLEVSVKNKADKQLTVLSCTKYDGLVSSLEYFGRKIYSDDVSSYKIVPRNHFAYATNHIEEGSIGYQAILDEALISPMYTVFKTDDSINDTFFFKLLKSHRLVYEYNARMEGSIDRRGGLRWDAFSIIRIKIPTLEEQIAIAQVLQAAVKEIQLLKTKTEKLREQKKGMMQVLLTGKKRLKN